jgi:hypothetical protein
MILILAAACVTIYPVFLCDVFGAFGGSAHDIQLKMGKDELVAMESLAKNATALQCGLDDIVEVTSAGKDVCNEV